VLTHSDFWSGNALWNGDLVTGVVDWCGARNAPRGLDVAWCRLDLVLLGSHAAADAFLAEYEAASGIPMRDRAAWDRYAAARADPIVESWAVNYDGIGRSQITSEVLRRRFDRWADHRLTEE
jgi:aminoglycoside phosphotransferase (APT) family kinase protein